MVPGAGPCDHAPVGTEPSIEISATRPLLATASLQFHWPYAITIGAIHLLALLAVAPSLFSWAGVITMAVGVHIYGDLGINLCYHRLLTHRSLKTPKWLERTLVFFTLGCLEDTPAKWATVHRYHHQHADAARDPHSPLVAFLWAHVGWLLFRNPDTWNSSTMQKYARDILEDPVYMRLEKIPWLVLPIYLAHALVFFAIGFAFGGLPLALSLLVWGVFVRTVIVWHLSWAVNSFTHVFGYRNYETDDVSRNNAIVAILTSGEGWHNNHHHDQRCATTQLRWWEFDLTYYTILLLERLGLASDVVHPRSRSPSLPDRA